MEKMGRAAVVYCFMITIFLVGIHWGSMSITTMAENRVIPRESCVVIDPGHGGEDGGAVSCAGIPESKYNLEIALRLNDMLNLLGYKTRMIRTSDISVYKSGETLREKKVSDLKHRVEMINETSGAVLISIHQNYYPDDRYCGAQVFYAKTEGSERLAKEIQSMFAVSLNPGNARQIQKCSGIFLMEHIKCPGVLIECGFLSNAKEAEKLKSPSYQKEMCSVIAAATCQYLSNT